MARKLFFCIFQNEIWKFYWIVTLAFWGMKGLVYLTSGPDKLQPCACSSWLLEAVVRKPANCKELSLEFLERLKDIIQDKSEGIVAH